MFPTLLALATTGAAGHYRDRSEVVIDCSTWTGASDVRLTGFSGPGTARS